MRGSDLVAEREQSQIKSDTRKPPTPEILKTAEERKEWHRLCRLTQDMGVLARPDGNALARYVRMLMRWRKAEEFLREHGEVFSRKREDGTVEFVRFPQGQIADNLALGLLRLEQHFGLTPSARASLRASPEAVPARREDPVVEDRFSEPAS